MTERKVKLDRANKSILLRALGDVYYGQRAHGGSTEVTGRLILRVNDLPAGGKLTMSAAEYGVSIVDYHSCWNDVLHGNDERISQEVWGSCKSRKSHERNNGRIHRRY